MQIMSAIFGAPIKKRRQKLKIVFSIELGSPVDVQIGDTLFQVREPKTGNEFARMTSIFLDVIAEKSTLWDQNSQRNAARRLKSIRKKSKAVGHCFRQIELDHLKFDAGNVGSRQLAYVEVCEKTPNAASDWNDWIRPFCREPEFVQGWVSDVDYDYWQNATDLLEYSAAGKASSHLPLKSNGLPFPLEKLDIDTSENPGRWTMHDGFIEAVGSPMWIGKEFFVVTGTTRSTALQRLGDFEIEKLPHEVIKICAKSGVFHNQSTKRTQDKMRTALYL
jgi:hypothetical protein